MADNIEIEQRVLDGDLIGPVNAEIDTKDFTGLVALENSLLDGTGSEISIELSESLGVIGLDDLVEVKSEIDKSVLKAESTVTEAQRQIDKANATIADLNAISTQITTLVGEAKQAAATATNEAADAGRSETAAAGSAKAASDSQKAAATSQAQALASQKAAATSQAQALASQKAAKTSETNASGHEARTLQSEKNAAASAKAADTDQKAALAAQKAAELARDAAKASENTASTHAGSAFSYKTDAETALASAKKSEAAAAQSAKEAETSASSMTQSVADARTARDAAISARDRSESARDISVNKASIATTKAAEASSSASSASSSASAAKTSETNALNSQRAAKTSETNSKTSETNSKASERVALASKDAAAKSATAASASAADAKKSQDAAKASRDEAEHFAEELRKGSVYRGIWNPNSNKYPDVPPTNSRWDVQLNKGQLEKIFDGKEWNWGDRLIYVLETKSFDIIDSGTGVTSINGETGSVTINRDTLGALGKTEKAADSAKLEGSTKAQIIAKAREGLAPADASYNKAESDSKYLPKNTNIDLNVNDNAHIGVNAGTNKDATFYLTEDSGKHGAYIRYNGSAGNNRTYLGTRSSNAETAFAYVERGSKDLHVVGNVTLDTEQSSVGNSLTRRDWVQSELDKKASTTKATIGKVKMQLGTTIGGANVDNAPLLLKIDWV
ncbi:tail protein [Vibrio phage Ceto]|uniref:Tail fiber protein n=1 Tax=Vibrio phage Ceto TaxID=2570300 RepID=A0A2H5BGC5_9CAUD|nr:tail protein [Vibrio phage Ceto]AUG85047.1 tail fiber protein [Vibrio phage Ceto]